MHLHGGSAPLFLYRYTANNPIIKSKKVIYANKIALATQVKHLSQTDNRLSTHLWLWQKPNQTN